jgi:hypothetical protein
MNPPDEVFIPSTLCDRVPVRPGISEATIRLADIHYCDYPEKDSICIPYRDADDHLTGFKRYRLPHPRPDGQKYHQDKGTGVYVYYTPGGVLVLPPGNQFGLAANSMLLVEGEFKALSLYDATVPVLGLPSFNVYQRDPSTREPKLYPDIEIAIRKWAISTIYFLGDADTVTNFEFSRQAAFLANTLGDKLQVLLPRLPLAGPKGIDDYRGDIAQSFASFFRELIRNAILLDQAILPLTLSRILLETHRADFSSLRPIERDRHSKRLIELCIAARRMELSPASADLVDLVGEILRRGKREMAKLITEADRRNQAQKDASASQGKRYPPEFTEALRLDGEPAAFTYNDVGSLTKVELLEPFWARLYTEHNDIVFVQETGQFKLYDPNIGLWEFLAPSSLEDELSVLIRQYAAKVPILADLENQRSQRILEHIRSQVKAKVTAPNPFRKERSFKTQAVVIAKYLAGEGKFSLLRTRQLENRFELGNMRDSTLLYGSDVDRKFLMHEGIDMLNLTTLL